jgi:hypothetical protein
MIDSLLTEIPAAALMLLSSYLVLRAYRRRNVMNFALLGLSVAALTLTKASFLYISVGLWIGLLLLWWIDRTLDISSVLLLTVAVAAFSIPVGGWAARNYNALEKFSPSSGRAGRVLYYRVLKSEHPFGGMIYAWSPPSLKGAIGALTGYGPADMEPDGRLARLNRANSNSIHRGWFQVMDERYPQLGPWNRSKTLSRDNWLKDRALENFASHPGQYLRSSVAFLYRGGWVSESIPRGRLLGMPAMARDIIGFVLYAGLLVSPILLLWRRRTDLVAILLLPIGMVLFASLLTHSLPRYNYPLLAYFVFLPVIWYAALRHSHVGQRREAQTALTDAPPPMPAS